MFKLMCGASSNAGDKPSSEPQPQQQEEPEEQQHLQFVYINSLLFELLDLLMVRLITIASNSFI